MKVKFSALTIKLSGKFKRNIILGIFLNYILRHIISKWGVLIVIHNFRELKNLANNAKIRSSFKFQLIWCKINGKGLEILIISITTIPKIHQNIFMPRQEMAGAHSVVLCCPCLSFIHCNFSFWLAFIVIDDGSLYDVCHLKWESVVFQLLQL